MRLSDKERMITRVGARAKTYRPPGMCDREVELSRPDPDLSAQSPTERKARIECKGAVNERYGRIDVLAEICECMGGIDKCTGIVAGAFQRALSAVDSGATVLPRVFGPAVKIYEYAANRAKCQCGSVMGISVDCLFERSSARVIPAFEREEPAARARR